MALEERLRDATLTATSFDPRAAAAPPARARAVVIGGGIIGASVAVHLARLGWTDTVVLERSRVASGTSWHAAGLMTRTRGTHVQTELASLQPRLLRGARGALRRRRRLLPQRLALGRAHAGAPDRAALRADDGPSPRPAGPRADARRDRRRLAAAGHRRPRRWGALRGRRDGRPRLGRPRDRQGGPRPGRARGRGRARHRVHARPRPRRRRADRPRDGGVRSRRHRRRAVVARPRPARRRPARAAPFGALLGADRADRGRHSRPAHHSRPRRLHLRASLPRRPHRRRVRAGRPPAHDGVDPGGLRLRRVRAGRGALRAAARPGARPRAGAGRGAHRPLPVRAGELHAGRQLPARGDRRGHRALRRRRHELAGHHPRPRRRPRARGVDRRGGADRGRGRPGRAPLLASPGRRGLPLRAHPRVAGPAVRDALAVSAARHRARPATGAIVRSPGRGRRLLRRGGRLGARHVVRTTGRAAGVRVLLRPPELVRRGRRRAPRRPRGGRAVRPLLVRQAARGGTGRAGHGPARLHRGPRPSARKRRLHGHAQRARRRRARRARSRGPERKRSSS